MEQITLTFGTEGHVNFSVSSTQNNYTSENLLPIVIEENGPQGYVVNIFGSENLNSVFPVFKTTETSFFKFEHQNKTSPCIKVSAGGQISSFPFQNKIYGLEILNKNKEKQFEEAGGHSHKTLIVWFGPNDGTCFTSRTATDGGTRKPKIRTEIDGLPLPYATIALNNSSLETYRQEYFQEPRIMNKRTFSFRFQKSHMMDNLYLN